MGSKDRMPVIVIIIDELADLMMSGNKKEVESAITRIAQKARAVGLHMILATQRPSVDVITGLIREKNVKEVVIGYSLNRDGKPNAVHAGAESLLLDITLATGLPVHFEPEQYSTQAALRIQGRNDQTDAAAAALIVDSYLMKRPS